MSQKPKLVNLLKNSFEDLLNCYNLYEKEKYLEVEKIYTHYYINYNNDPDIMHNLACSLFMQKKYTLALEYFKKSSHIAWSYHSSYHFISSALYYNKALITKDTEDFKKSYLFYHENDNAKYAINGNIINIEQAPTMFKSANTLGDLLIFEKNRDKFSISDEYLESLKSEHFKYHCMTARQFFNRAICFSVLKKNDIAKFDTIRAIEFDANNPDNEIYKNFAENLYLS